MRLRKIVVSIASSALVVGALVPVAGPSFASAPATVAPPTPEQLAAVAQATGSTYVATPADTTVMLYAGLPHDSVALAAAARAVSTPGTSRYRSFMTLHDAGRAYGASVDAVAALRQRASRLGLTVDVDATRLFARLSAPASTWADVLGSPLVSTSNPVRGTSTTALAVLLDADARQRPRVPSALRGVVTSLAPSQTVAPTTSYDPPAPAGPAQPEAAPQPLQPLPTNTGTPGTSCLTADQLTNTYTPSQLHDAYGTTALRAKGMRGAGTRMTVVALGSPYNLDSLRLAAHCFGYRLPPVVPAPGDGVTGMLPGRDLGGLATDTETLLDLQVVAPILTDASSLRVVQTPSSDTLVQDVINGISKALDVNGKGTLSPDVISVSYGMCSSLAAQANAVFGALGDFATAEDLLALAGIVGTSVFVAAGDSGSGECLRQNQQAPAQEVSWPASSPWVTSVGGTLIELDADNTRASEQVWNNAPWFGANSGAGGGGPALGAAPWYQPRATAKDRRVTPDVVAHASDIVGWPLALDFEVFGQRVQTVESIGGTSAASPFVAANFALLAARERAAGRPSLGFLNPWLYRLAATGAGFYDIAGSNNQMNPATPCCVATKGFDQASGLGAPTFTEIAARIRAPRR